MRKPKVEVGVSADRCSLRLTLASVSLLSCYSCEVQVEQVCVLLCGGYGGGAAGVVV